MKRAIVFLVIVVAAAAAFLAYKATTPPPNPWPKEPDAFLGVHLGAPLLSSIHPCDPQEPESKDPCFESLGGRDTIENVDGYWEISVDKLSGNVSGLTAYYDRGTGDKVLADLLQRFGKPHEEPVDSTGKRAIWRGSYISVVFYNNNDGSGFVTAGLNDHRYKPGAPRQSSFHWPWSGSAQPSR